MRPAQMFPPTSHSVDDAIALLSRIFGDLLDGFEYAPRIASEAGPIDILTCNVDLPAFRGSVVVQQPPEKCGTASLVRSECPGDAWSPNAAVVCTMKLARPVDVQTFTRAVANL